MGPAQARAERSPRHGASRVTAGPERGEGLNGKSGDRQEITNKTVAALLEEIADLVEIDGTDARKAGSYRRAARTVSGLREDLWAYVAEDRLEELPGIGPAIAAKIRDFYQRGSTRLLDELRVRIPEGVRALLAVPGLGPRTLGRLYRGGGAPPPAALPAVR
ncbi:MAG: histidinol-phosphatase, partial [Bacillota bacterium]